MKSLNFLLFPTITSSQLISKINFGSFKNSLRGIIETNDGGKIEFKSNEIIKADGSGYSGTVEVFSYCLDLTWLDVQEVMPGNLVATNTE